MEYLYPHRDVSPGRSTVARTIKNICTLSGAGLFILAATVSLLASLQPRGLQLYSPIGDSMGATMPRGSLAVLVPEQSYQAGEIVAFQMPNGGGPIAHRIIGVTTSGTGPTSYQTKGDTRPAIDRDRVYSEAILGRVVVTIPVLGFLLMIVQSTAGFVLLVAVPATVVLARQVRLGIRRWRAGQFSSVVQSGPPLASRYDS